MKMTKSENRLEPIILPGGLNIGRLICGLWQIADMEKDGTLLDPVTATDTMQAYVGQGFDTLDMVDLHGSADLITGHLLKRYPAETPRPIVFTKRCTEPSPVTLSRPGLSVNQNYS